MYMLYHEENIGYSYMHVCTCMYVLCYSVNTCTHSVVGPSYFVVWFSVDDTIHDSKKIVGTTVPSVDLCYKVE